MKKIILIISLIVIIIFLAVSVGYLLDNNGHLNDNEALKLSMPLENKTEITLYSNNPLNVDLIINEIKDKENKSYNTDTIIWMKSLKQKEVFISNNSYVIMDQNDANKIKTDNTDIATDTYEEYYIECYIIEKHILIEKNSFEVLYVKDVKFLGNKTFYYEV